MIDRNMIFDLVGNDAALWCGADMEAADLAQAVDFAIVNNLQMMSVAPGMVETIWPWIEATQIKIMPRFYLANKKISEQQISDVTVRINAALKQGASGAQVFLPYSALAGLVEQTHIIRDDLFFNKDLSIGLDLGEIGPFDWDVLYANLRKINASSVVFVFTRDTGDKSDFVGRMYAMLNAWGAENKFGLHFAFGANFMRIEQAKRLTERVCPELVGRLKFWVNV